MAEVSAIAWTDSTFNPWIGCTKVGPGCENCYAEQLDRQRFSRTLTPAVVHWGAGAPRHRTAKGNWVKPLQWNERAFRSGEPWRVFCASLADVFDHDAPEEWRADLFDLIKATPNLTWLLLTKRIANAAAYRLPKNVWLGITVVNQEEAERDIPKLINATATKRFLSIEPQLGPVDLTALSYGGWPMDCLRGVTQNTVTDVYWVPPIDWVICGGESGGRARLFDLQWARSLRDQCAAAYVPFFMKQLGTYPHDAGVRFAAKGRAGADMAEWPKDLRIQQFPQHQEERT